MVKTFVEGGFTLPEAKSQVDWVDGETLLVGTDFGPGSLTDSGYPRLVKRWHRGQPLADAVTVFEVRSGDMAGYASVDRTPGYERISLVRLVDFYKNEHFLLVGDQVVRLDKPKDAQLSFWRERLLIELRSDWSVPELR